MKKALVAMAVMAMALTGCNNFKEINPLKKDQAVGMVNPASEFCIKQGGKSEIRKNADGSEYGVCILKNGQEVDEWDYFRNHNK